MTHESLTNDLKTKWLGRPTIYFPETDSTNKQGADLVGDLQKNHHGTAIIAETQTAGRGTGGSSWVSDQPDGMLLTLILQYPLKREPIQFVPAIAAVRVLKHLFNLDAHVKWPNDILYENRKIGGILCEKTGDYCIVGIGLNINREHFPEEIREKAISVYQIVGQKFPIEPVFQNFLDYFEEIYDSRASLTDLWKIHSKMIGRQIKATRNKTEKLVVTVTGLSPEGYLQVQYPDGKAETWISSSELDIDVNF